MLETAGLRLLTDPTFDPAGSEYPTPVYTLRKTEGPSVAPGALPPIDTVLLSHDHHFDNLDHAGREVLARAGRVLTTPAGAERLGGHAAGLAPWKSVELDAPDGTRLRITSTPARHGPPDGDRGPVTGFLITDASIPLGRATAGVYISGDTVWYDGVQSVADRADVLVTVLFLGAARVREVGPAHLTFTAEEGVLAARLFSQARVIPVHYAGWAHFSEGRPVIQATFDAAGLGDRVCWLEPGKPTIVSSESHRSA